MLCRKNSNQKLLIREAKIRGNTPSACCGDSEFKQFLYFTRAACDSFDSDSSELRSFIGYHPPRTRRVHGRERCISRAEIDERLAAQARAMRSRVYRTAFKRDVIAPHILEDIFDGDQLRTLREMRTFLEKEADLMHDQDPQALGRFVAPGIVFAQTHPSSICTIATESTRALRLIEQYYTSGSARSGFVPRLYQVGAQELHFHSCDFNCVPPSTFDHTFARKGIEPAEGNEPCWSHKERETMLKRGPTVGIVEDLNN